jgi:hypothetical protein
MSEIEEQPMRLNAALTAVAQIHERSNEWTNAITLVQSLDEAHLIEFFYEALAPRRKVLIKSDGDFEIDCYTVASSNFGRWRGKFDDSPYTRILALPTKNAYDTANAGAHDSFFESGQCERCSALVDSVAKEAVCPICDAQVGLT